MKKARVTLLLLALLATAGRAAAVIGTIDNVPAATLLLPFFEVDLADPQGVNTLFSINNSAPTAVLVKVVVWSEQAVPVLDFNVYLTGYDVQTVSLRDILVDGNIPRTASDGQDPTDTISPQGELSQDVDFASCTTLPPTTPALDGAFWAHMRAWLTGLESPVTHTCAGAKRYTKDFQIARGYATVDTVNACNVFFPGGWTQYAPFVTHQNVLWGDWFLVNAKESFAQGDMLVHIESCPTCFAPGDRTFYGRYNGAMAADGREPLPTTWASRFLDGGPFDGGTDLLIWRETDGGSAAYACTRKGPLSWYPLDTLQVLMFDEQETPVQEETCPGDPTCPWRPEIFNAAQRIDVDFDLASPFDFGWLYANLQHSGLDAAQSWVIAVLEASGRFSVGYDVLQLDTANDPAGVIPTF